MSDRWREVYLKRYEKGIERRVKAKNATFHAKMKQAGEEFKKRHPELYANGKLENNIEYDEVPSGDEVL